MQVRDNDEIMEPPRPERCVGVAPRTEAVVSASDYMTVLGGVARQD